MNPLESSAEFNKSEPVTGALILAAGASARMGFPKQLLIFNNKPMIETVVETALAAGCNPVVTVLGAFAEKIRPVLEGRQVIIALNPEWASGMGSSIAAGMKVIAGLPRPIDNLLILLGDQPFVQAADLQQMMEIKRKSGSRIAAAAYAGQLGVPALFDRTLFQALSALDGQGGAKQLFRQFRNELAVCNLPSAADDLDTPEDVRRLL